MKINLDGLEAVPELRDFYIENEQCIELCSSLALEEMVIIFSNLEKTRTIVVRSANNVPIAIPVEMLKENTTLHIEFKLMKGSKILRSWVCQPITLKKVQSGLQAHTMDCIKEVNILIDRVDELEMLVKAQASEIAMLKQRINPIKDVL